MNTLKDKYIAVGIVVLSMLLYSFTPNDRQIWAPEKIEAKFSKKGWITDAQTEIPYTLKLDSITNIYTLQSTVVSTTMKGDCKHTNGCTIQTNIYAEIDAWRGKVIFKSIRKEKVPNYE